jgi:Zn-dependent protease with chaperone function
MVGVEFDFVRYVERRRGAAEQRSRDGAAYSYAGDRKARRTLGGARPVALAIEAANRLWKGAAKNDLLGTSIRVTDQQFGNLQAIGRRAAAALGVEPPSIYVAPASAVRRAHALGTDDDAYVVVSSEIVERLTENELLAVIGQQCGAIQNNHVVFGTALYYLTHSAMSFVRWIVQPAIMALQAWSRRADISCDRAALICTRSMPITLTAFVKVELGLERDPGIDIKTYLEQLPGTRSGIGKYAELFRSHPYLPKRAQALQLFGESSFYRRLLGEEGGQPADQIDHQVGQILSVL